MRRRNTHLGGKVGEMQTVLKYKPSCLLKGSLAFFDIEPILEHADVSGIFLGDPVGSGDLISPENRIAVFFATYHAKHTGEDGPVPPTQKETHSHYVYALTMNTDNQVEKMDNSRIKKNAFPKPDSIDVHRHLIPDRYRKALNALNIRTAGGVPLPAWDPVQSKNLMDRVGIATAMLSISSPGVHFGDDSAARDLSRQSNEYCAEVISDNPSRFGAFAVLPLPDVDGSLKEAEYALDTLKLDGVVMLASQSDGTFLGDKKYDDLLAELDKRKTVVFIHPTIHPASKDLPLDIPAAAIEFPFDTSRAAFNLVWTGAAERYPNIRYILSHAVGTLPFLAWRFSLLDYYPGLYE